MSLDPALGRQRRINLCGFGDLSGVHSEFQKSQSYSETVPQKTKTTKQTKQED